MVTLFRKFETPAFLLLGLLLGFLAWGKDDVRAYLATRARQPPPDLQAFEAGPYPGRGPEDAPVTIVVFGDYQCPYCQQWQAEVLPLLLEQYPTQVRWVYVDYPLPELHPEAFLAAEAAHCAGEQSQFWPFHEALFAPQARLGNDLYLELAAELKLDRATFEACLTEGQFAGFVRASRQAAQALGLTGTPAFLINGRPLMGAQPFEVFQEMIAEELAR